MWDSRGWNKTKTRQRSTWRSGWDLDASAPPDPGSPKSDRRNVRAGYVDRRGDDRVDPHTAERRAARRALRTHTQRTLRVSGYIARRWGLVQGEDITAAAIYADGPAAGLQVVDPWSTARQLGDCGSSWDAAIFERPGGGVSMTPTPRLCGKTHVCPVCAALASTSRAEVVADAINEIETREGTRSVHATLTHRASPGEPLNHALLRLRRSWRLMWRGRRGRSLRAAGLLGYYYGDEAAESWRGKDTRSGGTPRPKRQASMYWHAHRHVILILASWADPDALSELVLDLWVRSSAAAAAELGLPGCGAGRAAYRSGAWWSPLWRDTSPLIMGAYRHSDALELVRARGVLSCSCARVRDDLSVYQACKYAGKAAEMGSVHLAEYVAVARGRRWHGAGGVLYGMIGAARERVRGPSKCLTRTGGSAPTVDQISPQWGLSAGVYTDDHKITKTSDTIHADGWIETERLKVSLKGLSVPIPAAARLGEVVDSGDIVDADTDLCWVLSDVALIETVIPEIRPDVRAALEALGFALSLETVETESYLIGDRLLTLAQYLVAVELAAELGVTMSAERIDTYDHQWIASASRKTARSILELNP